MAGEKSNGCATNIPYSKSGDRSQDEILLQPFTYLLQVQGKQIRVKLSLAFDYWLHINPEKLNIINDVVQMLHNASLLRGIPVAHSIYGVASTINSANYVYFLGLEKVLGLNHPQATEVFCEQLLELHRGQGMEIYWRDSYVCPTEEEYRLMIVRKTGGLFGLAVRLMQLFSTTKIDMNPLMAILGLYFQIRDDYANLNLKEYAENKSFCEDLTEGKFSFPVIHAIRSRPDDQQIINILRQRTKDMDVKRYCVSLLEKFGSFEYTRQTLIQLDLDARREIEKLGGNPILERVLDELKNW
ncbi:geranylgeranyl pyrophosphate synthase-like isoform X2 [Daphnia pulex]|uniref:geranylgeranyl pyrophosphate synthase-like isoform X2 n=1 Tax=Daphnia pulex TaxID=6669 RepID=UPI001EDD01B1|nr:geranylgeranyl pyrophosphate synthase-like isoform X2 [Daphnia pulex]